MRGESVTAGVRRGAQRVLPRPVPDELLADGADEVGAHQGDDLRPAGDVVVRRTTDGPRPSTWPAAPYCPGGATATPTATGTTTGHCSAARRSGCPASTRQTSAGIVRALLVRALAAPTRGGAFATP
ncbi:hypothetical protein [Kitasatospora sp. NPDC002965]|uniref:hypothetical protein n=1 Tax=Kitasatospora sp. NPDC002965 TaxID=3154775 RepID=UPI0033A6D678